MNALESQPEHLGPYRIESILGRGGMGTVYAGTHVRTGERVAVKVIADAIANQERFRRRFDSEVETLKRLSHKHIVRLIGYGEEDGRLFYSMEYVAGESLQQHLKSPRKLSWQTTLKLALQISSALKHAHDLGIVHRDLKPANLLLDADGELKVTDFGIAKIYGNNDETVMGSVLGTADYMPPEQAEGLRVTAKSDLYALGAVIYTCLTGQSPHAATTVPEALYNARYKQPPPISQLGVEVPRPLDELTMELLRKDPAERPATAFVVLNRLTAIQLGQHLAANSPPPPLPDLGSIQAADTAPAVEEGSWSGGQTDQLPPYNAAGTPAFPGRATPEITLASEALLAASHRDRIPERATQSSRLSPEAGSSSPQSRRSHFVSVEDEPKSRKKDHLPESDRRSHILSIAGLSLLLLACIGGIWYSLQPPTADELYAEASAAIADGSDSETAVLAYEELAALYPGDPRLEELAPVAERIKARRFLNQLHSPGRFGSRADPVEIALAAALETGESDPELTASKLRSFLEVFADDELLSERQMRLRTLAAEELARLESTAAEGSSAADNFLREQFDAATKMDRPERIRFYRSVIQLFSDVPAARKALLRAQALLQAAETAEATAGE